MNDHRDLPLFKWNPPPCQLIPFPPSKRIGKARDVARKWFSQRTERQADQYSLRIEADLNRHLEKLGVPSAERKEMSDGFWSAVRAEIARLQHGSGFRPGGNAA